MLGGLIEMETKLNIGMAIMGFLKRDVHVQKTTHVIGMFTIISRLCNLRTIIVKQIKVPMVPLASVTVMMSGLIISILVF